MKEWLAVLIEYSVEIINLMALVVIAIATLAAFVRCLRTMLNGAEMGPKLRDAYIHYGRWLIGGLTFQLAGDIIETSLSPGWEHIAHLGAIALIRTFLSYFLDRDMEGMRERREADRKATEAWSGRRERSQFSPEEQPADSASYSPLTSNALTRPVWMADTKLAWSSAVWSP